MERAWRQVASYQLQATSWTLQVEPSVSVAAAEPHTNGIGSLSISEPQAVDSLLSAGVSKLAPLVSDRASNRFRAVLRTDDEALAAERLHVDRRPMRGHVRKPRHRRGCVRRKRRCFGAGSRRHDAFALDGVRREQRARKGFEDVSGC